MSPSQTAEKTALDASDIHDWCQSAHGPELSDDDANKIASAFNKALFEMPFRVPDVATSNDEKTNLDRWRSMAAALKVLQSEVPIVLEAQKRMKPSADHSFTEGLLQVPNIYQGIIDCFGQAKEHPRGPTKRLTIELSNGIASIWARYGKIYEKSLSAFVQIGLNWMGFTEIKLEDDTIRRNRRRYRTK